MSKDSMEEKGFVNNRFIIFLKATLGRMVATKILGKDFLDLHFWQLWPKKFYQIRAYDSTKNDFVKQTKNSMLFGEEIENDDVPDPVADLQQSHNSCPEEIDLEETELPDIGEHYTVERNSTSILSNSVK